MKIVILDGYTVVQDDLSWDGLNEFGELIYHERTNAAQVIERTAGADMIITSKCVIDKTVIDSDPTLKYIGVIATGYNNVDIEYAKEKGITVTNIPAYSTDSVAQFAFSLILEAVNQVGLHSSSVHRGDWTKSTDFSYVLSPQTELFGKTMGIVGYGNIGKKVASIANAFNMDVIVHSSHMQEEDSTSEIHFVELGELLSGSDIISLHCALTDKNKKMINKSTIDTMKDGVIIVNVSRGPLVNEQDLADALKSGKVQIAALDVLTEEPPKNGSPLMNLDNCIITPHIAWITKEARQRLIDITVENVRCFVSGTAKNTVI